MPYRASGFWYPIWSQWGSKNTFQISVEIAVVYGPMGYQKYFLNMIEKSEIWKCMHPRLSPAGHDVVYGPMGYQKYFLNLIEKSEIWKCMHPRWSPAGHDVVYGPMGYRKYFSNLIRKSEIWKCLHPRWGPVGLDVIQCSSNLFIQYEALQGFILDAYTFKFLIFQWDLKSISCTP